MHIAKTVPELIAPMYTKWGVGGLALGLFIMEEIGL